MPTTRVRSLMDGSSVDLVVIVLPVEVGGDTRRRDAESCAGAENDDGRWRLRRKDGSESREPGRHEAESREAIALVPGKLARQRPGQAHPDKEVRARLAHEIAEK